MAQQEYRANLSAAIFPLTIAKAGRTVIVNQIDNNYDKRVDAPGEITKDVGIPQVLYMENAMPTPNGYQSVGFKPLADIPSPGLVSIEQVRMAVNAENVAVAPDIELNDPGTNYADWSKTATNLYAAGVPPDPGNEYQFWRAYCADGGTYYEVGDHRFNLDDDPDPPAVIARNLNLSTSNNITMDIGVRFMKSELAIAQAVDDAYPQRQFIVGLCVNSANHGGAGLKVIYNSADNTLRLSNYSAYTTEGRPTNFIGTVTATDFDEDYRLHVTYVVSGTGELTLTCELYDDTDTLLGSVSGVYTAGSFVHGNFLGLSRTATRVDINSWWSAAGTVTYTNADASKAEFIATAFSGSGNLGAYASQRTQYFDIVVDGVIDDTTSTIVSGIETIDLAFHNDGTVTWSRSSEETWEDNPANADPAGDLDLDGTTEFSWALVKGVTYVCLRASGVTKIYQLSIDNDPTPDTLIFTDVTTDIGDTFSDTFQINDVKGISGSYNYLLLHTATVVFWSSTTTPTDFAASLVSGAGSETPNNLKGDITFLKEHVSGFYIYTTKNVVFAAFTGNRAYPWKFREIGGSGGYNYNSQVSGDTNSNIHYGLNNSKFVQLLAPSDAELRSREITDFLERVRKWDIFNYAANTFSTFNDTPSSPSSVVKQDEPRIWFLLDRYVVLPYGVISGQYTYAFVFDTLLQRYGKLAITFDTITTDESNIFFVDYTALTRKKLYFDINYEDIDPEDFQHEGVLLLGKFQLVRGNMIQIEGVEIEAPNQVTATNFFVYLIPTLDGKTFTTPVELTNIADDTPGIARYYAHTVGQNISLLIKGAFDINTVQLVFHQVGKR